MEEKKGLGILCGRGSEDGEVPVWMKAADDFGTWRPLDAQARSAECDAAVWVDACAGALAPDVRPPRAAWSGAENRALLAQGKPPCGLRGGADLAMVLMFVAVDAQCVDQGVGRAEGGDRLGGEDRRQALLPEIVEAFDFALGLWRGGVAQGDFVKSAGRRRAG